MEMTFGNLIDNSSPSRRLEALKTLTKLLLQEVETLAEISLPANNQAGETDIKLNERVQRYEINLICHALLKAKGNQRKAAKLLGTKTTTLHAKIKRYEIDLLPVFGQLMEDESLPKNVQKTE